MIVSLQHKGSFSPGVCLSCPRRPWWQRLTSHSTNSSALAWCLGSWIFLLAPTFGSPAPLDNTVHTVTPFPDLPPPRENHHSTAWKKKLGPLNNYFFSCPAREQWHSVNQPYLRIHSEQRNHLDFRQVVRKYTWENFFLTPSCMNLAGFHWALKFLFCVVCFCKLKKCAKFQMCPKSPGFSVCPWGVWLRTKFFVFPFLSPCINYIQNKNTSIFLIFTMHLWMHNNKNKKIAEFSCIY